MDLLLNQLAPIRSLAIPETLGIPSICQVAQVWRMVEELHKAFKVVDILLGPTIPITPPAYSEGWLDQNLDVIRRCLPFTAPVNLTGTPSLSVPMGLD